MQQIVKVFNSCMTVPDLMAGYGIFLLLLSLLRTDCPRDLFLNPDQGNLFKGIDKYLGSWYKVSMLESSYTGRGSISKQSVRFEIWALLFFRASFDLRNLGGRMENLKF